MVQFRWGIVTGKVQNVAIETNLRDQKSLEEIYQRELSTVPFEFVTARIEIHWIADDHKFRTVKVIFPLVSSLKFDHRWIYRIYFLSSFILVLFLSFYFISNVYEKWSASPVIITLGAKATFITDFPFPAVTICNMNKARMSIARDFKNGSLEEALLQNFCLDEFSKSSDVKAYEGSAGQWSVFKDFLKNISQSCDEMLIMCRFSGLVQNCMELFETVMTDEGLCCTFNAVHSSFLYQNFE